MFKMIANIFKAKDLQWEEGWRETAGRWTTP